MRSRLRSLAAAPAGIASNSPSPSAAARIPPSFRVVIFPPWWLVNEERTRANLKDHPPEVKSPPEPPSPEPELSEPEPDERSLVSPEPEPPSPDSKPPEMSSPEPLGPLFDDPDPLPSSPEAWCSPPPSSPDEPLRPEPDPPPAP